MFEIREQDPEVYRSRTRRSALIIMVVFAVLAMALSTLAVQVFGDPDGSNFRWNLLGVLAGLVVTLTLVRKLFWAQPWMAEAAYGWELKRNLMRITNVMHKVEAGVAAGDPMALRIMRFYHLGLIQMHRLDDNSTALLELRAESQTHLERLERAGIDPDQSRFDPGWLAELGEFEKPA
ncbi:DUF3087 domain-containing protein [Pseudomonas sp.]|jgi:hypothetical protein|uniref:DUF3087 domain-containing protein n=1 Tax=Pseudomonas sp. TaxID=306 RepID=UPI00272CE8DE|nr:DUF3087 domain-containing protein [Pseudomonas sp.]